MGRPPACDCHCDEGECFIPQPCVNVRCTERSGGILRQGATTSDITPEFGAGTASGITIVDLDTALILVACNHEGDIYRTEDSGDDWTRQTFDATLNDVHARNARVIIVGNDGTVLRSSDQGQTWTTIVSGVSDHLLSVWLVNAKVGFACGENGALIKTTDGGVTWSALNSGVSVTLRSVHFFDKRNGFAVGDSGTVLHTTNGGTTWAPVTGISDDVDCVLMLAVRELEFTGFTDCSANPNYPAASAGDDYYVTVAGRIGGASGKVVAVGDLFVANETNAGGTEAAVGTKWDKVTRDTVGDVVMFANSGSTSTRKWSWDGVTLKDDSAGPTITVGNRLKMCGITCEASSTRYLTQEDGCVVCPYHSAALPVIYRGSNGPITTDTPTAQHQNRDGDVTQYTVSLKQWGGIDITSHSLTTDEEHGMQRPCMKLAVEWSQTAVPPPNFPQAIAPPGLSPEPLFGAWVVMELNGGPQISLADRESLTFVSTAINAKMIAATPPSAACSIRIIGTATAGTWTIDVDGETTTPLAIGASLEDVETAVGALTTVEGNVSVSGWPINTVDLTGSVSINNGCKFVFKWTDGTARVATADTSGLTFSGSHSNIYDNAPAHWRYEIVPVVIREGVIYGPAFAGSHGVGGFDPDGLETTTDTPDGTGVETCWRYLSMGPDCGDVATTLPGNQNHDLHSRYREYTNPAALPSSLSCSKYCRGEDAFGDWENAEATTFIDVLDDELRTTWLPPTLSFDSGDFTVGFAVGFVSDVPGDYTAELLLDNLCLEWATESSPFCGETLVVDEPLDTLPSGWSTSDLLFGCSGVDDFVYSGHNFRIESGALITDDMDDGSAYASWTGISPYFWRQTPYGGGSFFTDLDFTGINPNTEDFCLTIECELEIPHERDGEWYEADRLGDPGNPTPLFDLNSLRPTTDFGIFIGGIAKFGVVRNSPAGFNGGGPFGCGSESYYELRVDGRMDRVGSVLTNLDECDPDFVALYNNYYCTDGTIGFCGGPGTGCHAVPYGSHVYSTAGGTALLAPPLQTVKLRMEVKWSGQSQSVFDCLAQERFYVRAWINDRPACNMMHAATGNTVNIAEGTAAVVWQTGAINDDPTVGVYSHRAGKWRNFKVWVTS